MHCALILFLQLILVVQCVEEQYSKWDISDCRIMARKSTINGIGYFASRNYKKGDLLEIGTSLSFMDEGNSRSELLIDYMFSHEHDDISYIDLVLGYSMVFNHYSEPNVQLIIKENDDLPRLGKYSHLAPFILEYYVFAERDIIIGK